MGFLAAKAMVGRRRAGAVSVFALPVLLGRVVGQYMY